MIEANQLRVGNLVNEKVLGDVPVDSIGQKSSWVVTKHMKQDNTISDVIYHINNSELFPIPLTPEVFGKTGFEKYEWMDGYFIKCAGKHLMIQFYKEAVYVFFTKVSKDSHGHKMFERDYFLGAKNPDNCVYLHQLQNLFWVLTGEELTVNL